MDDEIKERLSILFDHEAVEYLHYYHIVVENVGKRAVKDQQIMFEFPEKAGLISEPQIDHKPLVGPVNRLSQEISPLQICYEIDLLAKKQTIELKFYTKENEETIVSVFGRNETDTETELIEASSQKAITKEGHLQRLLILIVAYFSVPPLLDLLFALVAGGALTEDTFFFRQFIQAIKGGFLLLAYPSAKYLLAQWFSNYREMKLQNVQIDNINSSQLVFASEGSSFYEVEMNQIPDEKKEVV